MRIRACGPGVLHPKPPNGVFESDVGAKVAVVADLFTIGWFTHCWSTAPAASMRSARATDVKGRGHKLAEALGVPVTELLG